MNLAIFDLDGTLTDTNEIDTSCFFAACEAHGIDCSNAPWSSFADVTDRGIATALCELHFADCDRARAYDAVRSEFLAHLGRAARDHPERFLPVPGAVELLDFLDANGWATAIATGAWSVSATIKLETAGFRRAIAVSSSDERSSRCEIVRDAIELAQRTCLCAFDRVVIVGDARWDVATAAELALPFVGRASAAAAAALRAAGAGIVLKDFTDLGLAHHALITAKPPRRVG